MPQPAAESEAERVGLRCPRCNCPDLRVTHSRPVAGGKVRRYRRCRHCDRRLTTLELFVKDAPK